MSRLDALPPDLRAVLSLLLSRGRSYAEIAGTLHIEERAVRDRAHAALAMLAPRQARELTSAQRERVGEHVLGQAGPTGRREGLAELEASASARAWARALAAELGTLAAKPLPEIPAECPAEERAPTPTPPAAPAQPVTSAAGADPSAPSVPSTPTSRIGGMVVLGAIAVVIVAVVLIVAVGVGGGSHSSASTAVRSGSSAPATTSTSKSGGLRLNATLPLTPPDPASRAVGIVDVASSRGALGFVVAAEHLPPTSGFRYAAWLYNSQSEAVLLGQGPTVGSSGTLKAVGLLPADASRYHRIILTEEHSERPARPGPVVLSGAFKTG